MTAYYINIVWKRTPKQKEAWKYLTDRKTTEILYGGAAGGGKTFLGCAWLLLMASALPNTRWLMGRAVLKALKQSTLLTFFDLARRWGFVHGVHLQYKEQQGIIQFKNGSQIFLKDLFAYPSDPEFDSLGSTEYTGAFIDEASQVTKKAKDIVMSRIRYKLDEYNLVPKLLIASNPAKNWMYQEFYKPWRAGNLPEFRKFVPSKVTDNPFISKYYVENLKKLPRVSRERLLKGNWEYEDDAAKLVPYDNIIAIFSRKPRKTDNPKRYLTCDIARMGSDKTVIYLWEDLHLAKAWEYQKLKTSQSRKIIQALMEQYDIPPSRVVIDEDGVGGGVVDEIEGVKGFVNNSKPIPEQGVKRNYANLKSQCTFKAADYINQEKISVYKEIPEHIKEGLITDIEQYQMKDPDKDGKLAILTKDAIKQNIGRSPDYGDAFMMRMFFELTQDEWMVFEDPTGTIF